MIVAAARELAGQHVCFVGVGLPNIAVNLAKRTVAPDLELVYEAGVFGARPARLPLSIGDPTIVTGATAVVSMFELFALLPPARPDRRRVPGRGPDRPLRQHQHDGHRRLQRARRRGCRAPAAPARSRSTPAGVRDHAPVGALVRRTRSTSGRRPATSAAPSRRRRSARPAAGTAAARRSWSRTSASGTSTRPARCGSTSCTRARPWTRCARRSPGSRRSAPTSPTTPAPTAEELRLVREELDPEGVYTK